jgi:hypothetical protein
MGTCANDCTRLRGEDTRVLMSIADVSTGISAKFKLQSDGLYFFLLSAQSPLPLPIKGSSCVAPQDARDAKLGR